MQANSIILGTGSAFRLRRPPSTSNGFVADIDPRVKDQLDTLQGLLSARVFHKTAHGVGGGGGVHSPTASGSATQAERQSGSKAAQGTNKQASSNPAAGVGLDPALVLPLALTPKRARDVDKWAQHSLAAVLDKAAGHASLAPALDAAAADPSVAAATDPASDPFGASTTASPAGGGSPDLITLTEFVDRVPDLSTLKYAVDDALAADWNLLSEPLRRVLDNDALPAMRVYLVAYAFVVLDLRDVGAVKKFILNDSLGASQLVSYAAIGAARELVADKGFNIPHYDVDNGQFVTKIQAAQIGLSTASFEPSVMAVVNDLINDVEHKDLIDEAEKTLGPLSLATRRMLAQYIDVAPVPITMANVTDFATVWLAQNTPPPAASPTDAAEPSDADFNIEVFQDDASSITISRSSVVCSAQLYYTMVLGDELDVYTIVKHFTHNYLVRGAMEITDPVLRTDLQNYVFSNRFTDTKTGRLLDRTRQAERGMFYRQVFGLGHGEVPSDLIINDDFPSMWKVLMLESATYLERAQASLNPDGFVSKQKVMQAVEDLQYNLSTHCVGMATVATPLMHAELNFAIRRILMHPEVLKQVVPVGGTWWRVVERLYMDLKHSRPKSTALYNKAKLGHDIIKAIADYNPATFESDTQFSAFISDVDAYITTQSILQAALTDDLKRRQEDPATAGPTASPPPGGMPGMPGMPTIPAPVPVGAGAANGASASGHAPADEWDF